MSQFKLLGELPSGEWRFGLVHIKDEAGVIVVIDTTGRYAPRMIVGGKLVELTA